MRPARLLVSLLFSASSLAQGPPEGIAPSSGPPPGCQSTVDGTFKIGTLENPVLKHKRQVPAVQASTDAAAVTCSLKNGILHDGLSRTGSVVANRQFQFDGPPQAGAIYTGGFSVCKNGSLAIGGSTRWWRCMSGAFGNLYDQSIGDQCHEIRIQAIFPQAPTPTTAALSTAVKSDFASASSLASQSLASSRSISASAVSSPSATPAAAASNPPSKSSSLAPSTVVVAPPARTNTAASPYATRGATLGAVLAILGAALIL